MLNSGEVTKSLKKTLLFNPPRKSGFLSGGLKENGQNPDIMEAKTVKTKKKIGENSPFVALLSAYKSGLKGSFGALPVPNI